MKILSWDVGINNLAYCFIDNNTIIDWDIMNLRSNKDLNQCEWIKKKRCGLKGKLTHKSSKNNYCLRHAKIIYSKFESEKPFKTGKRKIFKMIKKDKDTIHKLGRNMIQLLKEKTAFLEADYVLIENQPVLKNPTMKSIQMILYSYFLISGVMNHNNGMKIHFITASNKLKAYQGPPIEIKTKNT